jgi:hypothetical protein
VDGVVNGAADRPIFQGSRHVLVDVVVNFDGDGDVDGDDLP